MKNYMRRISTAFVAAIVSLGFGGLLVLSGVAIPAQDAAAIGISDGLTATKTGDMPEKLDGSGGLFTKIVNILLFVIGAVAVVMIIVGGIRYVTSGGDQAHVKAAKDTILYSVIGLVVAILAYAIVNFVVSNINNGGSSTTTTTTTTP